jgi:hypothetical protein
MWMSLVIGLVSSLVAVVLEPVPPELPEFQFMLWIFVPAFFLLPAALIFLISHRKNWARIILLLLMITGLVYFLDPSDLSTRPLWWVASEVLTTALDLTAMYWLFSGEGSAWFRSSRRATSAV